VSWLTGSLPPQTPVDAEFELTPWTGCALALAFVVRTFVPSLLKGSLMEVLEPSILMLHSSQQVTGAIVMNGTVSWFTKHKLLTCIAGVCICSYFLEKESS
jgi:hypothetical protein